MSNWVPAAVVSGATIVIGVAERFYVRFYPDVETQKRHLKWLGLWVGDLLSLSGQAWVIWDESRTRPPITASIVVRIALLTTIAVLIWFSTIRRRIEGDKRLNLELQHIEVTKSLSEQTSIHYDAILFMARKLNLESHDFQELKALLDRVRKTRLGVASIMRM